MKGRCIQEPLRRGRLVKVILWLAVVGLLAGAAAMAAASTPSGACPAVYVLTSRGSGDTLGKDRGLSAPGLAVTNELQRLIPGVASWANSSPAVGVFSWHLRQLANGAGAVTKLPGLGAYHASVVKGKRLLDAEVTSLFSACATRTALILVGYSQGAQVTADVYQRELTPEQRSIVAAVVLFGDSYFNGADRPVNRGSFSGRRDGLLGRRPRFGATGRTLVLSYCHSHDPICQGLFFRRGPTRTLDPGSLTFKQHTNYTKFGEPQRVADLIARHLRPPSPPPSLGKAVAVTASVYDSCALLTSGNVVCWGHNPHGELGDGTTRNRTTPSLVHGLSGAMSVSAGTFHTCAALQSGAVRCWGFGANGQLGNGRTANGLAPVSVYGIQNASAVASGDIHTCAALRDGTGKCWGWYGPGQLGNGTAANSFTDSPVRVSGLQGATGIAAAAGHSCAVVNDGTVQCWGTDDIGQLGDGNSGTDARSATPVQVLNIASATSIAAGDDHTCARLADGTVACWGANSSGELGDGTTTDRATPVAVSGLTDATSIATGLDYSCATRANGQVACWGANNSGQLGNGTMTASRTPVPVIGLQNALSVAAGSSHACAVRSSGGVVCWGDGSLGNGTTVSSTTPVAVRQLG